MKFKPLEPYPIRSPLIIAEVLKPMIKGKVVCDLGCGEGDFLLALKEMGASKVIGVEMNEERAQLAISRGLEVIIGDVRDVQLPIADVYYDWLNMPSTVQVLDKIKSGVIIVGSYITAQPGLSEKLSNVYLDIPFTENNISDVFRLHIVNKNESLETLKNFRALYHDSLVIHTGTEWMGRKAQKCPNDAWVYQDLLQQIQPDFVIETGTAFGGGALFLANMLDIIGHGNVITIENDPNRPPEPLNHSRVIQLKGSSVDDDIVSSVKNLVNGKKTLIILDSDHLHDHVLKELELYSPLTSVNSYVIIEDTHMQATHNAVDEFLAKNDNFVVDKNCERFIFTFNPGGFLKRIK